MQNPSISLYTVDELKHLIGTQIQEHSPSDDMVHATNIILHLVNECSFTFFTMTDYTTMKYFFVSPKIEQMIGYPYEMFANGGLEFLFSLQHPDETDSLRLIHKQIVFFFNSLPSEYKLNYSYAYDVRLRKADGAYIRLLCQLDCEELDKDGHLSVGRKTYTDITSYDSFPYLQLVISHHNKTCGIQDLIYRFNPLQLGSKLPKREKEVNDWVSQGLSSKEIGEKLNLSKNTVDTHRRRIREKEKEEDQG